LVDLALDGNVFFHADEGHDTLHFGHDRVRVRVPFGNDSASIDLVAFLDGNHCAVGQLVTLALTPEVVRNRQFAGTRYRDQCAVQSLDVFEVVQTNGAAVLHQYVVDSRGPARRATDV